ncbi:MAG: hypothetical protein Q9169_001055 [Polycauliona sp. 2 TL-2023]
MDDGDEDAQSFMEHCLASTAEVGTANAGCVKGFLTCTVEVNDLAQEDDIFAVEFLTGGVNLEAVVIAGQTFVQAVDGVHFPLLFGCDGILSCGAAKGYGIVRCVQTLLVWIAESLLNLASSAVVLEDLVDREGDSFPTAEHFKHIPHGREPVFVDGGEFVRRDCCEPERSSRKALIMSTAKRKIGEQLLTRRQWR